MFFFFGSRYSAFGSRQKTKDETLLEKTGYSQLWTCYNFHE